MPTHSAPALTLSDTKESRRKTTKLLPVTLTDTELLERGRQTATAMSQKGHIEAEMKAAADGYKRQVKLADAEIRSLLRAIDTRSELRDVEVEIVKHYDVGSVVTTRTDTGEVIRTRPMSWDERQMKMGLGDEDEDDEE